MDLLNMDTNILLSIINTKLRDFYSNLEDLCYDLNLDINELNLKLGNGGYYYKRELNQFK